MMRLLLVGHEPGSGRSSFAVENHHAEDREAMQSEARRISNAFTQEQQRHDLMMKIQQARQRQTLQRKLYERQVQQRQQHELHNHQHLAEEDEGDDEHSPAAAPLIAPKADLIREKSSWLRDAKAQQYAGQAVKGLALPTNLPKASDPKAMQSRGMNLGPLMRK